MKRLLSKTGSSLERQRRRRGAVTCNCWSKRTSQCELQSRTWLLPNYPSGFQDRRRHTFSPSPASQRTTCTTPEMVKKYVVAIGTYQGMMRALVSYTEQLLPIVWLRLQFLTQKVHPEHFRIGRWLPQ